MPDIQFEDYKLGCVHELFNTAQDKEPRRVWVYRMAYLDNLNYYWLLAVAAVRLFQESIQKTLDQLQADAGYGPAREDLNYKVYSSAISCYNNMRICLRACQKLAENAVQSGVSDEAIATLQEFRRANRALAWNIVTIRNLVGAHPDESNAVITGGGSWSSSGNVTLGAVDLDAFRVSKKESELKPGEDLLALRNYICGVIPLIKNCWGI